MLLVEELDDVTLLAIDEAEETTAELAVFELANLELADFEFAAANELWLMLCPVAICELEDTPENIDSDDVIDASCDSILLEPLSLLLEINRGRS